MNNTRVVPRSCAPRRAKNPLAVPPPAFVLKVAAAQFGVSVEELLGPRKYRPLINYRMVTVHALRSWGHSVVAIAEALGRHHTTVASAVCKVDDDSTLRAASAHLVEQVEVAFR